MTTAGDSTAQPAPVEAAPRVPPLHGRRLAVRADGSAAIGTGHLMRCLAVAARWVAAGGAARLACTDVPDAIAGRYAAAGVTVERRQEWPAGALLDAADAILADLTGAAVAELPALAAGPGVLVTVDDLGDRSAYPGDILLNHNAHATPGLYRGRTSALLCLGAPWCLLRAGFTVSRDPARPVPESPRRIVVLLGGADPKGLSSAVLQAVADAAATLAPVPDVVLVVGAANPAAAGLRRLAETLPGRVEIRQDVRDMPALLAGADLAVSAAGSTAWELAALGVPMILGAQNVTETGPAAALQAQGAALYLGPFEALAPAALARAVSTMAGDRERRRRMRDTGMRLVDGLGVDRLVALVARLLEERQAARR